MQRAKLTDIEIIYGAMIAAHKNGHKMHLLNLPACRVHCGLVFLYFNYAHKGVTEFKMSAEDAKSFLKARIIRRSEDVEQKDLSTLEDGE